MNVENNGVPSDTLLKIYIILDRKKKFMKLIKKTLNGLYCMGYSSNITKLMNILSNGVFV